MGRAYKHRRLIAAGAFNPMDFGPVFIRDGDTAALQVSDEASDAFSRLRAFPHRLDCHLPRGILLGALIALVVPDLEPSEALVLAKPFHGVVDGCAPVAALQMHDELESAPSGRARSCHAGFEVCVVSGLPNPQRAVISDPVAAPVHGDGGIALRGCNLGHKSVQPVVVLD